ncbi:CYTH and CHAD domain-containing protein [Streptomyces sp. RB6PN25]|uniref:CYTH and CHAD domain-containing protein n=1 Tax=Streptomyces humicola TaxID=2953240 RepID=A0ABT1PW61_9ACTN|nr:CYTH and CHAD domain-containing protein [Streptomyces humicola]MCQ4081916.1 CYTH and CHAD domain-containing protein [Streptomyces humicola]
MGKRLRETERKYEADAQAGEPDLNGIDGVAAVRPLEPAALDAVYFDTADLRLARHHITLRRRTGGDDAGWHLKLPAEAADTRTEVHAPLGRAPRTVPKALADEVAVHVRGRRLVPVLRLKNDRERVHLLDKTGGTLAEMAYDHVTAELLEGADGEGEPVQHWTETEVELVGGGPELLDAIEERLAAAGLHRSASPSKLARALGDRLTDTAPSPAPPPPARPETAGDAVLAYLHKQVRAITELDPAVRRDEPDSVHRMRVATRRLRSALRTYARELDRSVTGPVADELKWLAGVLGAERDREVLAARLADRVAELEDGLATDEVTGRLRQGVEAASHSRARAALLRELRGDRYCALLDSLDALLADPPLRDRAKRPADKALTKAVRRDHRRLARRMAAAIAQPPGSGRDVALHEARKAAKRARYAAESAQPVLGRPADRHRVRMTGIQQLLGEHQDSVMCRAALVRIAREAHAAGEDTFAYGALHQLERDRAAEVEETLPAAWRRADRGRLAG